MKSTTAGRSLPDPDLEPTISVPRAGRILGISRAGIYRAAERGELPTKWIDARVVVLTRQFLDQYDLSPGQR